MKVIMGVFVGIISGIFIALGIWFAYQKFVLQVPLNENQTILSPSLGKVKGKENVEKIDFYVETKSCLLVYEEKLNSINKRIDEFYILGGVIITLMLAITASVFLKAEYDIDRHFNKNFGSYLKEIKSQLSATDQGVGKQATKEELERLQKAASQKPA